MNLIQTVWLNSKLLQLLLFGSLLFIFSVLIKEIYNVIHFILHYRSFPQLKGNFFIGNIRQITPTFPSFSSKFSTTKMADLFVDFQAKKNEGVYLFWSTWLPIVAIVDYRAAEAIFSKPNHNKGYSYKFLGLRDGLVVSHGPKWKARRKMIEPFFHTKSLASYVPTMTESFNSMTKKMEEEKVKFIDMSENIHKSSFDIIMRSAMSVPLQSLRQFKDKTLSDLDFCEKMVTCRMINPLMWLDSLFYKSKFGKIFREVEIRLDHFLDSKIKERLEPHTGLPVVNESEREMRKDFIDLLLNHYNPNTIDVTKTINIEGMKEEILNLIIAGHDTIASGLRWTLFLLGCNLDCQEKLYDEIASSLDENDDNLHLGAISKLAYLDQCIKESLRLYPPVPILMRVTDHDAQVGDYRILKGTQIIFSYFSIHRDRKVWENPDSFDPDRFSEERYKKIPKYAFIPFGYGQRSCIGKRFAMLEMKVFIIHLIRKYKIISTQRVEQVKFDMDVTMKPRTHLTLKLEPRNEFL